MRKQNKNFSFSNANNAVLSFYTQFQEVFQEIDALFKSISNRGGKDASIARDILDKLISYHREEDDSLFVDDAKISSITSIETFYNTLKEFQTTLHDTLISDSVMTNFLPFSNITTNSIYCMLVWLKDNISTAESNIVDYYASLHILRELVSDYSLFTRGLQVLAPWNYGTRLYSMLSAEEQLVILLNQAILIDRMYFCIDSFETVLMRLNLIVDSFDELDWTVYYITGLLNYKIHNYDLAHKYLIKINSCTNLIFSDNPTTRYKYFHSLLLTAYSYEYDGKFAEAIESIAINPNLISNLLNDYSIWDLDDDNLLNKILESICELAANKNTYSLFNLFLPSFKEFCSGIKNVTSDNKETIDKQFEILHCFAHCLNEYSISERQKKFAHNLAYENTQDSVNYGKIIHLARRIMLFISKYRSYYRTCYATIHGECQDYTIALKELDDAYNLFEEKIANNQQHELDDCEILLAEINFYKYYFNLLINVNSSKEKEAFEQYCRKYDDGDAECHLKIFEFRNELRKYLKNLFNTINELIGDNIDFSETNLPLPCKTLVNEYNDLCQIKPTLYLNINVRAELRLVQRAYICIEKLREYLVSPSSTTLTKLKNAGQRFLSKNVSLDKEEEKKLPSDLPHSISTTFSIFRPGIFNRLFNNDSIFILAPISEVKGFEYQTGKTCEMFTVSSILPTPCDTVSFDKKELMGFASGLHNCFLEYSEQYRINILSSNKWQEISLYVEEIFYWNTTIPSQILVAKFDNNYEKPNLFSRQIQDTARFVEQLHKYHNTLFSSKIETKCNQRGVDYIKTRCAYQKVKLPKMEVINEDETIYLGNSEYVLFWHKRYNESSDVLPSCFIIREKNNATCNKHKLHKLILEIHPSEYLDDTANNTKNFCDVSISSETSDSNHDKLSIDNELEEIFKKIEQNAARVKPVLQEKVNSVIAEMHSLSKGKLYNELQIMKEELEANLSKLIEYSDINSKNRFTLQEHRAHLNEFCNIEQEILK